MGHDEKYTLSLGTRHVLASVAPPCPHAAELVLSCLHGFESTIRGGNFQRGLRGQNDRVSIVQVCDV